MRRTRPRCALRTSSTWSHGSPVGFRAIRLSFDLDTDASEEELATLLKLTERYCVVFQTLNTPPELRASIATKS